MVERWRPTSPTEFQYELTIDAEAVVKEAGLAFKMLDAHVETPSGHVAIGRRIIAAV